MAVKASSGSPARAVRASSRASRERSSVSVQKSVRPGSASPLYVLQADTSQGRYLVHLDPDHGYLPAYVNAQLKAGYGHQFYGRSFDEADIELTWEYWNLQCKKIQDAWVPAETEQRYHRRYTRDKFEDNRTHTRFTKVTLNPDHSVLNSFYPDDVLNGTPVFVRNVRFKRSGATFLWQNGTIVADDGEVVLDFRLQQLGAGGAEARPAAELSQQYTRVLDAARSLIRKAEIVTDQAR